MQCKPSAAVPKRNYVAVGRCPGMLEESDLMALVPTGGKGGGWWWGGGGFFFPFSPAFLSLPFPRSMSSVQEEDTDFFFHIFPLTITLKLHDSAISPDFEPHKAAESHGTLRDPKFSRLVELFVCHASSRIAIDGLVYFTLAASAWLPISASSIRRNMQGRDMAISRV